MAILKVPYNGEWAIIESPSAVRFTEQELTETEKARARANIGALGAGEGGAQPDWNQNDETAEDFIKNRTHWAEMGEVALVDNVSVDTGEYGYYDGDPFGISNDLEEGTTYTVILDGTEYNVVGTWDSWTELVYIGDYTFITAQDDTDLSTTNPPFCYWGTSFATSTGGVHTVTIMGQGCSYHKIDANFLPDGASIGVFGEEDFGEKFNKASYAGSSAHAEGRNTTASGSASHAEGSFTEATGSNSHAEGGYTDATGTASHAEGYQTKANGEYSHAEGYYTTAASESQHVQGKYNTVDSSNTYAHIIGNGTGNTTSKRSNAHTVDWNGNAWFSGDVKVGGKSYYSSDAKTLATTEYVDNAIGSANGSASTPKMTTINLIASNWTGESNPWSQAVSINGVTENSKIDLQPTAMQIVSLQDNNIALVAENDGGTVTVYALGDKPTEDYTMQVMITECVVL